MQARIGDIDLHYTVCGQGPWLTLSHSLATHSGMWAPQLAALSQHFTLLCLDTRGHGQTTAPPGPYTLAQLADDAFGLLQHLGIARTHWLGLSMGGMVGQMLALRHPELLDRVVLADTTGRVPPAGAALWAERAAIARRDGMQAIEQPTLERWFTEPFRQAQPALMAEIGAMIRHTPVEGYAGCCAAIAATDTLEGLRAQRSRALVMVGEHDLATPPAAAQAIVAAWPGAQFQLLAGASHLANLEQPIAFNDAVRSFLTAP
jgi:3-oxoadipate enol-lactonase